MENLDWGSVLTVAITVITLVVSGLWLKAKGKIAKVVKAAKELMDVGSTLSDALADDKITKEEIESLKKEWGEAQAAVKAIFQKE